MPARRDRIADFSEQHEGPVRPPGSRRPKQVFPNSFSIPNSKGAQVAECRRMPSTVTGSQYVIAALPEFVHEAVWPQFLLHFRRAPG